MERILSESAPYSNGFILKHWCVFLSILLVIIHKVLKIISHSELSDFADMSARAFYETKLVTEFVGEFLGKDLMRPLSDQERIKVAKLCYYYILLARGNSVFCDNYR